MLGLKLAVCSAGVKQLVLGCAAPLALVIEQVGLLPAKLFGQFALVLADTHCKQTVIFEVTSCKSRDNWKGNSRCQKKSQPNRIRVRSVWTISSAFKGVGTEVLEGRGSCDSGFWMKEKTTELLKSDFSTAAEIFQGGCGSR